MTEIKITNADTSRINFAIDQQNLSRNLAITYSNETHCDAASNECRPV